MADDGGGSDVDLSAVAQDIVPDADGTRDLGSANKKMERFVCFGFFNRSRHNNTCS